jgi:hypothetical protein
VRKWEHNTSHLYFNLILVGFQEEMLWFASTICEKSALFLEEENQEIAEYFCSETFLFTLAYLSDIFGKFNLLNTSMQGYDTNIPVVSDKVNAFVRKIGL